MKRRRTLPPQLEQRAIATALSDVDALITALDRLIAKKRAIKTAAMQQLLTGKTRLPGFTGEWETKRLGELGSFLKGSNVNREEALSGSIPCVRYGELYTAHNDVVREFCSWISPAIAEKATKLKKGDVLFAGSGETKEEIGKSAAFVGDFEAYAGGDIVILRPVKDTDPRFLGYAFNAPEISQQKSARGQGDAGVHISATALSDIEIKLPSTDEQTAIAQVLSDMDAEIAALEARRDKTRVIKQGMMQQLLTGKTRLPGFTGEWETKRLGEVATLHRESINPASYPATMFTHYSLPAFDEEKRPAVEVGGAIGSNKFIVSDNAILVSKLNPRIPRVWMPAVVGPNAIASTEFLVLTPKEGLSREFLYVLCSSDEFGEEMELHATGTTGSHQRINPSDALQIQIKVPNDKKEQTAIAQVLSDMDAEIAALEARRDKTRVIKQGMMQQLLTGWARLV